MPPPLLTVGQRVCKFKGVSKEILRVDISASQFCTVKSFRGQFVVHGQELPTAYVHAKFEDRSFIRLRNISTFRCAALIDPPRDLDF